MMIKKLKDNVVIIELIFSIASAVILIHFSELFWTEERLLSLLFNVGVDLIGLLVCAALIYGSMRQKSEGTRDFRLLILRSCALVIHIVIFAHKYASNKMLILL